MTSAELNNIYEELSGSDSDTIEDEDLKSIGRTETMMSLKVELDSTKDLRIIPELQAKQIEEDELAYTHQHTFDEIHQTFGGKKLIRAVMWHGPE